MLMKIANAKDNREGTHQTVHCYKFLIERELESCRLLILCSGRPSFTRISPKQMCKYLKTRKSMSQPLDYSSL